MKNLKYLISILLISISFSGFSQTDTEFWFVAPEVTSGHGDSPISFRLNAFDSASSVTISQPANIEFIPIVVNIPANGFTSVNLTTWKNICVENDAFVDINASNYTYQDLKINPYGFNISATSPITAYYEVERSNNPEIFTLKGHNALGLEFMIPSQNYMDNKSALTPDARSSFDIVATEDNTTITITPSNTIEVNHTTPYTIILNKGETYSATAASRLAANHLFGTFVTSDKPIAITIKDDSVYLNSCYDLLGDQIIPIEKIGNEYIAIKGALTSKEGICVNSVYDNTEILVDGILVSTINKGQVYKFEISGVAGTKSYIQTSEPAYVLQITGFGCEGGMALLPAIKCTGSNKVVFSRTNTENFEIVLMTKSGSEADFTIISNNDTVVVDSTQFTSIIALPDYVAAKFSFLTTDVQVGFQTQILNSTAKFHCGVINGGASTGCRYGYFSNYEVDVTDNDCVVTNINFETKNNSNFNIYPNISESEIIVNFYNSQLKTINYSIYSIDGRFIKSGNIRSDFNKISINNFENGIYFIEINNQIQKFIKF